jgi:hypothetical protein
VRRGSTQEGQTAEPVSIPPAKMRVHALSSPGNYRLAFGRYRSSLIALYSPITRLEYLGFFLPSQPHLHVTVKRSRTKEQESRMLSNYFIRVFAHPSRIGLSREFLSPYFQGRRPPISRLASLNPEVGPIL